MLRTHETLSNRASSYGVIVTHWIHSHETLSNRASSYRDLTSPLDIAISSDVTRSSSDTGSILPGVVRGRLSNCTATKTVDGDAPFFPSYLMDPKMSFIYFSCALPPSGDVLLASNGGIYNM